MEAQFPDTTSVYAAEGTLAHSLAELKVSGRFKAMSKSTKTRKHNKIKKDELYSPEMEGYTDGYLEYIESIMMTNRYATLEVETRLNIPGVGFGTADCIILSGHEMWVIDLKYGKNVQVSAQDNEQMKLYAAGAYNLYKIIYDIQTVHTVIYQPRMNNISEADVTAADLTTWLDNTVLPAADLAGGKQEGAQLCAGDWCIFCRAKGSCEAYVSRLDLTQAETEEIHAPEVMAPARVSYFLTRLKDIEAAFKALKENALITALSGTEIPGFKVVEGRSSRAWKDPDEAFKIAMEQGFSEEMLYERKPLTLPAVEKLMGKKDFAEYLGAMVDKPRGKPALVVDTDNRPAYVRTTAADDFKNID